MKNRRMIVIALALFVAAMLGIGMLLGMKREAMSVDEVANRSTLTIDCRREAGEAEMHILLDEGDIMRISSKLQEGSVVMLKIYQSEVNEPVLLHDQQLSGDEVFELEFDPARYTIVVTAEKGSRGTVEIKSVWRR